MLQKCELCTSTFMKSASHTFDNPQIKPAHHCDSHQLVRIRRLCSLDQKITSAAHDTSPYAFR